MVEIAITIFFILLSIIVVPFALFMAFAFVLMFISIFVSCIEMIKMKWNETRL